MELDVGISFFESDAPPGQSRVSVGVELTLREGKMEDGAVFHARWR